MRRFQAYISRTVSVLLLFPEPVPGACVLTLELPEELWVLEELLPTTPGPWSASPVAPFLPPGPSFDTCPEDELPDELLLGPEVSPDELPPVPVESVVPERKEPETIPVSPSLVWVFPSYS